MRRQELRHDRRQQHLAGAGRRADAQGAVESGAPLTHLGVGALELREQGFAAPEIVPSGLAQRHAPRGSLQQPNPETALEARYGPTHCRNMPVEAPRRLSEALRARHLDECAQLLETIHATVATGAIVICSEDSLSQIAR